MSSKSFTDRDPATIGLVGGTVIVLILVAAFNFQRLPIVGAGPEYSAAFADASGLEVGEDVRIAGIKVGSVSGIDLENGQVVVRFRVKHATFGEETRASIEIKTLLGQHYVNLVPDGPGRIEPGSRIPRERTETPMNIVPAVQRLTETVQQVDTKQVSKAFDVLSDALEGTAPEIRRTLDGLSRLSMTVASRDAQVQSLLEKTSNVTGVLASRNRQLSQLFGDTNVVLDMLNDRKETIRHIIVGVGELSQQLTGLVRDNEGRLRPALTKLRAVVDVLRRNNAQLDALIGQVTLYGRQFTNVGGTGHWFDATVKVPRGFALCSTGPNTPLLEVLEPVLSRANEAVNGSSSPCLPLGPATSTAPEGQANQDQTRGGGK